ncbi:MAG TPA: helix-turn-helix domain-containing protein [Acidimicrobiales bacterium]|nr:helix-turn-helix domain-containing protein [Acidimicrobiales bacterium]
MRSASIRPGHDAGVTGRGGDPLRGLAGEPGGDEEFSAVVAAVTAAFGDTTRRQIYLHVREGDGVTAAEVAQRFALHPNVARHHLDKLAAGGYLEVSLDHAGSGAGRPSKRYRRSSRSAALPVPPRSDALVVTLLLRALSLLEPGVAEQMAEQVGEEYGRSLAAQMAPGDSQRSMRAAMLAVADALTAHGFAAHAETRATATAIVRDHCPFGGVVLNYPVLCAVDRGMVQGLLAGLCGDAVPVQMSSRALGDDSCASVAG